MKTSNYCSLFIFSHFAFCVFVCQIVIQNKRLVRLVPAWWLGQERFGFSSKVYVRHRRKVLQRNWKVYDEWVWGESVVWSSITRSEGDRVSPGAIYGALLWLWSTQSLDH